MVIGIEADVFEVVVFAAGADAFLGVGGAARFVGAFGLAKKNRDELVHAGVREQEVRRIWEQAGRRHNGVPLGLEEVEEVLADAATGSDLGGLRHGEQSEGEIRPMPATRRV